MNIHPGLNPKLYIKALLVALVVSFIAAFLLGCFCGALWGGHVAQSISTRHPAAGDTTLALRVLNVGALPVAAARGSHSFASNRGSKLSAGVFGPTGFFSCSPGACNTRAVIASDAAGRLKLSQPHVA